MSTLSDQIPQCAALILDIKDAAKLPELGPKEKETYRVDPLP